MEKKDTIEKLLKILEKLKKTEANPDLKKKYIELEKILISEKEKNSISSNK